MKSPHVLQPACAWLLPVFAWLVLSTSIVRGELSYEKDVRPILKAHCFYCHGEQETEAALDVRLRRWIVRGGDSGPAIVVGDPGKSLLYERIRSGEMPPEDKRLSDAEVATIGRWIEEGAKTRRPEPESLDDGTYFTEEERSFWAFQPIVRPRLPAFDSPSRWETPIDAFIDAGHRAAGLSFSDSADKQTLVRRLYFDLLGLPPSPAAVDAYLADDSPGAYERLVDRLLASPRYGERWGRHWLDVAGYADSEGYVDSDPVRPWAYGYRDYVIRSFNADMPYDTFVREQLAGDELLGKLPAELPRDAVERLRATGFLRMAPDGTGAGGVDQQVARNEVVADTINILSTAMLGLTVGCARCHDHRYDPISQVDYYRLRALLEPALDWKSWRSPAARRISLYTAADRKLAAEIMSRAKEAEQARQKILDAHLERTLEEELIKAPDARREALRAAFKTAKAKRTAEQTALLKEYPNIQNISAGSLYLYSQQRARRAKEIDEVARQKEEALRVRVRDAMLAKLPAELRDAAGEALAQASKQRTEAQQKLLDEHPELALTPEALAEFDADAAKQIAEYRAAAELCRKTDSKKELADLQEGIAKIRETVPKEHFVRALTEPEGHRPATFLFERGNHTQPGQAVAPGELTILAEGAELEVPETSLPSSGRRLAYARHLTSGRHPLLARVMVNRIWYHHFGRGIVNTPGDFGYLGERPSHPELLDWLASEFMQSGWQIKRMHRLILLSRTYRQSSERTALSDQVDPDNRLYSRQSVRRVEAEVFRDAVLVVSGQYRDRMFGPAVPVMEDAVGQIVIGQEKFDGERKPQSKAGLDGEEHRRSVYVQVRRSRPLAVLETFDIATVAPNCTQRASSNVAPQSLLVMNSPFMVAYATAFADRVERESGAAAVDRIRYAWRLAYGELPSAEAVKAMTAFLERQTAALREGDPALKEADANHSAWVTLCQALLGANQFIYVD